jgi:hypothetical protein
VDTHQAFLAESLSRDSDRRTSDSSMLKTRIRVCVGRGGGEGASECGAVRAVTGGRDAAARIGRCISVGALCRVKVFFVGRWCGRR